MAQAIISTIITFVVSGLLGYCVGVIKKYKEKSKKEKDNENVQNIALLYLLQSQLTNTFFVYNEIGEISDYVYRNWLNSFKIYKKLGGNDYVDTLKQKMDAWIVVKTDILER